MQQPSSSLATTPSLTGAARSAAGAAAALRLPQRQAALGGMAPASSARLAAATLLGLAAFAFWGQERSLAELAAAAAAGWHDGMKAMEAAVKAAGWLAPLYFLVLYTVSSVFCLPLLGFHTVAGYTYGTLRGALLVSICQTVGAGFALLFARHFVRPMVQPRLEKKWGARYKAVDRAVAKQGLKIVFLIRASPILPFSVTNYLVRAALSAAQHPSSRR